MNAQTIALNCCAYALPHADALAIAGYAWNASKKVSKYCDIPFKPPTQKENRHIVEEHQMPDPVTYNRLRWICNQRSMHEMDVVLGGFLDTHYTHLTPAQAAAFAQLADMEDIDLWPLLTGRISCDDPVQAEVLAMLRQVRLK
ncbi:succinate dehydrogenase assembly factor 2 [Dentiradicibacter hellwigii]|uniref:FAD assembly factor SdhE n=1 Tax=Dentiradicibacter hellwigii TaxID=3149053 RepID=A0ABV4UAL2_9RHOO